MMKKANKLPEGLYFIGDPCYVVKDELWSEYCDESPDLDEGGVFEFHGAQVFVSSTQYGDGTYYDQESGVYPVDAGVIGATPLEAGFTVEDVREDLGEIIFIDEEFECEVLDHEGTIKIGDIEIYTGYEDEEDDYEEEY